MKKESQQALQSTTALQSVQTLGAQIKSMIDNLTPMMQKLQTSMPQLTSALQQIQQLETQIGQLEQIKSKVQQAEQTAQTQKADDSDKVPGGVADGKPDKEFDKEQLDAGQKVEMEHTDDKEMAREIAKDHLEEDEDYYKKLKKIHDDSCKDTVPEFWRKNLDYGSR